MKQLIYLMAAITIITSCKKDEIKTPAITSLTVGNYIAGGTSVKLGSNATTIANNNINGTQLALIAGENNFYVYPIGDSAHPYFTYPKLVTQAGEVYSLFLGGTPTAVDGILIKESIPYRTDSTAGIRFINLAANKPSINITLAATPTVNEASALAYKSYTEFKSYAGLYNSTYSFQVRDAANPTTVLTTFTLFASTVPRFANITLVIRKNGSGVAVTRVNQDR